MKASIINLEVLIALAFVSSLFLVFIAEWTSAQGTNSAEYSAASGILSKEAELQEAIFTAERSGATPSELAGMLPAGSAMTPIKFGAPPNATKLESQINRLVPLDGNVYLISING